MDKVRPRLSPLLRMAVKQGSVASVEVQLRLGLHPDACDGRGRTALMFAAEAGHAAICRQLLLAGADPLIQDHDRLDALAYARAGGFQDVVDMLRQWAPATTTPPDPVAEFPHLNTNPPEPVASAELDKLFQDDEPLNAAAWQAAPEDGPPPENDEAVFQAAASAQARLSVHVPVDLDEDWSDVEVDLPEIAELRAATRRRRRHDDEPILELLRAGLRLGWVQPDWIAMVAPRVDGQPDEPDPLFVANLTRTLEDVGVLVDDEVFDQPDLAEAVAGAPDLTDEQEAWAREGLSFLHLLNSWRAEPLNHWWQSLSKHPVVARDQEVALARMMQDGGREGLTAILLSPAAMRELLSVPGWLASGDLSLEDVQVPADDPDDAEEPDEEEVDETEPHAVGLTEDPSVVRRQQQQQDLLDALARLDTVYRRSLSEADSGDPTLQHMREILEGLVLTGPFIARLHRCVRSDRLAPEAAQKLVFALKQADQAREALILANLRLVSWVAKRYARWSFTDAIQEGCIGLMKAVERFDPHAANKFSTYGLWWIRQAITRARDDTARTIRVPVHVLEKLRKLDRALDGHQSGESPEVTVLAEALEMSPDAVRKLLRIPDDPLSLSDPDVEAKGIADTSSPDPEQVAILNNLKAHVLALLDTLEPREKQVVSMRFGLGGHDEHTLGEIGSQFGVTRERIRQIEGKALRKLAHPSRSKDLRSFFK